MKYIRTAALLLGAILLFSSFTLSFAESDEAESSWDDPPSEEVVVTPSPTPLPPNFQVYRQPQSENCLEGSTIYFMSICGSYETCTWIFSSPDGGTRLKHSEIEAAFPGVKLDAHRTWDGTGDELMTIENVPYSMNGWRVRAQYTNSAGQTVTSDPATITVKDDPAIADVPANIPTPTPVPTPEPAETPEPTPSPSPTPAPTPQPKEENDWAISTPDPRSEENIGAADEETETEAKSIFSGIPMFILGAAVATVLLLFIGIFSFSDRRGKKKKKKYRRNY